MHKTLREAEIIIVSILSQKNTAELDLGANFVEKLSERFVSDVQISAVYAKIMVYIYHLD